MSISEQSNIAIVSIAVFLHTSKLPDSSNFKLCLHSLDIQANSTKLAEAPDLSNVPSKYHKFTNVFSKTKAEVLASHWPYNLQINLEEGAQPPVGLIYSLTASKLPLCMVHWSYLSRRKIVHFISISTSVALTAFPKRIAIYSCSFPICWTHLTKLRFIQR